MLSVFLSFSCISTLNKEIIDSSLLKILVIWWKIDKRMIFEIKSLSDSSSVEKYSFY